MGEANARLIAAAPELLEELRNAAQSLETVAANLSGQLALVIKEHAMLARAAIAKATGND